MVAEIGVNFCNCARSDQEMRERFYGNNIFNSTPPDGEGTIAKMIDHCWRRSFLRMISLKAELETVAKISHEKGKKNETGEANGTKAFQIQDVFSLDNEESDDMATLIDKKDNVFVMSNKKSKYPILQVDFRLISDLVILIVSAAVGGIIFSCLGQPVIVGYLLAGSMIGPGGLNCISEMVQVETVAQFGVVFLLFALGLEFSMTKARILFPDYFFICVLAVALRAVGPVSALGGMLQIIVFMFLCGITAMICGGKLSEGVFVGSFLSMSSTAVVVKFLIERNQNNALHGQVAIGILIFQDCAVGLFFALLPVMGGNSGLLMGIASMGRLLLILSLYLATASILTWSFIPRFLKLMIQLSSQCSDKLGLSLELGSFVAGVMISTTDFAQHTLDQVEPIRNLFAALFLSSIGMLIRVQFLWLHVDILVASVILVVVFKTSVTAVITKAFGYSIRTSLLVGLSLAQIGEFAFVLLSRASNLHLIEHLFSAALPLLLGVVFPRVLLVVSARLHW
uniref:Cation/H+ exchanger transmembrane domain-containing protein n=1 Tax=Chenopodium quinoa TaxID=63459 RepID=A0A803M5E8_CHEQI